MSTATVTVSIADRLSSTLFLAALAHGVVILGVTFATDPLSEPEGLPSLNVTLLVDTDAEAPPEKAELLASTNALGGGGEDDSLRPTTTPSADHPLTQLGDPLGADLVDALPQNLAPQSEQLTTSAEADRAVQSVPDATDSAAPVPMQAATLLRESATETLAAELDDEVRTQSSDEDDPRSSPSTRESNIAAYLVGWRRRVERIGTANFPAEILSSNSATTRPILEVAIGADGNLEEIVVRRSSGDTTLDQAALKILRLASPFEPLPPSLLAEFDVLRFAYEWDFSAG